MFMLDVHPLTILFFTVVLRRGTLGKVNVIHGGVP